MKKLVIAIPALALFVLVGCGVNNVAENEVIPILDDNTVSDITALEVENEIIDLKQVPQDISEWTTYIDEEYGFEIQYPIGVEVQEVSTTPDRPYIRFVIDCEGDSDCASFGVNVSPNGRFQEPFYESELTEDLTLAGRAASIVTDQKLLTKELFPSIMIGDGSECKKPQPNKGISSALRFANPPTLWSPSDNLVSFFCSDRSHAPILKEMLNSFRFL